MEFIVSELVRENIKGLKTYSSARDEFNNAADGLIFLDANENPYENGINRYPDPQQRKLKVKLSEIKDIPANQILLGNGSDEILDLIFRAFCEPKTDNIILLPPTYGMYKVLANVNDIIVQEVNLNENFQPNVEKILRKVNRNTKLIFLCSPNNPTSNSFNKNLIETLLQNFHGLVVLDEAYIDFSEEQSFLFSLEKYPNLIITQTFSKAYGMAGIRLGICYASKEIIDILNKIKPPYNVNELTQERALKGLENIPKIKNQVSLLINERATLMKKMENIHFINRIYPSDANFILAKVDDANLRYNQLIELGIVVRNRSKEPLCENCLRFTVGTETENSSLFNAMKQIEKY